MKIVKGLMSALVIASIGLGNPVYGGINPNEVFDQPMENYGPSDIPRVTIIPAPEGLTNVIDLRKNPALRTYLRNNCQNLFGGILYSTLHPNVKSENCHMLFDENMSNAELIQFRFGVRDPDKSSCLAFVAGYIVRNKPFTKVSPFGKPCFSEEEKGQIFKDFRKIEEYLFEKQ